MIINLFLYALHALVQAILSPIGLLPDVTLDPNVATAVSSASSAAVSLNSIFPFDTLVAVLLALIGVESAIALYKGLMWLVKKIPTIN